MTNISRAMTNKTVATGIIVLEEKKVPESFINNISWGIIIGNPNMAMMAAFCWALAAMAARNVNTRHKPQPPRKTRLVN